MAEFSSLLASNALIIFQRVHNHITRFEDAQPALRSIAGICPVYALNKGNAELSVIGQADFHMTSAQPKDLSTAKSAQKIFRIPAHRANLDAADSVLIDHETARNFAAAGVVGMDSAWINQTALDRSEKYVLADPEIGDCGR